MLIIHHLANSQSERILWLCEELGVPFEIIRYERDPVSRSAPPEYKALHPFGTAPVITDGDVVLGESNAIAEYLMARHSGRRLALPADHPAYAQYLTWLHFANGSFIPAIMMDHGLQMVGSAESEATRLLRSRGERAMAISESRLAKVPYFAGELFTAADIMMTAPLKGSPDLAGFPHIRAYLQRIGERPAFQRAMQKAEPGRI